MSKLFSTSTTQIERQPPSPIISNEAKPIDDKVAAQNDVNKKIGILVLSLYRDQALSKSVTVAKSGKGSRVDYRMAVLSVKEIMMTAEHHCHRIQERPIIPVFINDVLQADRWYRRGVLTTGECKAQKFFDVSVEELSRGDNTDNWSK